LLDNSWPAGVQQTIAYLEINGNREIVDCIKKLEDAQERSDLGEWEREKYRLVLSKTSQSLPSQETQSLGVTG
jgi:hypothetical protein